MHFALSYMVVEYFHLVNRSVKLTWTLKWKRNCHPCHHCLCFSFFSSFISQQNAIAIHWVRLRKCVINTPGNVCADRMWRDVHVIDAPKVFGIWNRKMVVKVVLVMQSVVLISHAMHTPGNVIAKLALVVQHVIHAWKAIMVSRQMDVNVSDFLIVFFFFHKILWCVAIEFLIEFFYFRLEALQFPVKIWLK